MGTAAVLLVLAFAVFGAIKIVATDKKAGKSLQCGMDCANCNGRCGKEKLKEKKKDT